MYKQVIVIRKDLNMRKGKIAAQASHASMKAVIDYGFYEKFGDTECLCIPLTSRNKAWLTGNFKKICVYVNSEEELLALFAKANEITECALIQDSGLTEFAGFQPILQLQ